jgi:hypothetical protein
MHEEKFEVVYLEGIFTYMSIPFRKEEGHDTFSLGVERFYKYG